MPEFMKVGGWPMWIVLAVGLWLDYNALRYAQLPTLARRAMVRALSQTTLLLGLLGSVLGLIATMTHVAPLLPEKAFLCLVGLGETIHNLAFALVFLVVAAVLKGFGDARGSLARQTATVGAAGGGAPLPAGM